MLHRSEGTSKKSISRGADVPMNIRIEKGNKELCRTFSGTVRSLLDELGLHPHAVIVVKNNEIVLEQDMLSDTDTVRILSVMSGG